MKMKKSTKTVIISLETDSNDAEITIEADKKQEKKRKKTALWGIFMRKRVKTL